MPRFCINCGSEVIYNIVVGDFPHWEHTETGYIACNIMERYSKFADPEPIKENDMPTFVIANPMLEIQETIHASDHQAALREYLDNVESGTVTEKTAFVVYRTSSPLQPQVYTVEPVTEYDISREES